MSRPNTTHLFEQRKEDKRKTLTHEQIANDLAAFKRLGGKIEVLGNTAMLRTIPISATQGAVAPTPPKAAAKPAAKRSAKDDAAPAS
jgi:ribosomal 50S subunit-associated protein YjgA (DUF615 family)